MLKLSAGKNDGTAMAMFILEAGNIEKLRNGQPIVFNLREVLPQFPSCEIVISFNEDADKLAEEIRRDFSVGKFINQREKGNPQ